MTFATLSVVNVTRSREQIQPVTFATLSVVNVTRDARGPAGVTL